MTPGRSRGLWIADNTTLLNHGHWHPSQLETNEASEPEWKQLELPLRFFPIKTARQFYREKD
jgi:hypothetical protein